MIFNNKTTKYFTENIIMEKIIKLFKKKSYKREMKVIALFAIILISTTMGAQITAS
jgi:hypothetical protein